MRRYDSRLERAYGTEWREELSDGVSSVVIDSREVRARFELNAFEGQLFIHALAPVACGFSL